MSGGILSGKAITNRIDVGTIGITPFNPDHVNPASVDLTLGPVVYVVEPNAVEGRSFGAHGRTVLDAKLPPKGYTETIGKGGYVVQPGVLYLMHTVERVAPGDYVRCGSTRWSAT